MAKKQKHTRARKVAAGMKPPAVSKYALKLREQGRVETHEDAFANRRTA